jgi:hypothetical protein
MFLLHTFLVYAGSISWFPWLVYRWFDVATYLNIPPIVSRFDWYLQHLPVVNITLALLVGYGMARAAKTAAIWAWAVPALVLAFDMALFKSRIPVSVLGTSLRPASAIEFFFGTVTGFFDDPQRSLTQMKITAPFCAGFAYALGAVIARHGILSKVFSFETTHDDEPTSESRDVEQTQ